MMCKSGSDPVKSGQKDGDKVGEEREENWLRFLPTFFVPFFSFLLFAQRKQSLIASLWFWLYDMFFCIVKGKFFFCFFEASKSIHLIFRERFALGKKK